MCNLDPFDPDADDDNDYDSPSPRFDELKWNGELGSTLSILSLSIAIVLDRLVYSFFSPEDYFDPLTGEEPPGEAPDLPTPMVLCFCIDFLFFPDGDLSGLLVPLSISTFSSSAPPETFRFGFPVGVISSSPAGTIA